MFRNLKNILLLSLTALVVCIVVTGGAFLYGRYIAKQEEQPTKEVSSIVILDRIQKNYFVVTKTVFLEEDVTISIKENSNWNNLLWGHTINAEATIRMDVGVDMQKLTDQDIKVDNVSKKIIINLPQAEVLDTSLFGEMQIDTKSGILKQLFENDKSADFNLAVGKLKEQAEEGVKERSGIFEEARADSVNLIKLIVNDLGYEVEVI